MEFQQPNPTRLVVRSEVRSLMWERLWTWLLSSPSGQPVPVNCELTETPEMAASDGFPFEDSQAPESMTPPDTEG